MRFFRNNHLHIINTKKFSINQNDSFSAKESFKPSNVLEQLIFNLNPVNKKLSAATKFGYSLGHALNDMASSIWFCYSLLFFKLFFTNSIAGCLILIGQIADGIATPVIGYICDRQKCTPNSFFLLRAGRRKFWHIIGTAIQIISFPLTYIYPLLLENENFSFKTFTMHTIIYVLLIALFQGSWAGIQVSHVTLITDITCIQNERIALNAYRQATTVASNLLIYSLMMFLLRSSTDDTAFSKNDAKIVALVSTIASFIGFVLTIIFYLLVKEPGQCLFNKQTKKIDRQEKQRQKISKMINEKDIDVKLPEIMNNRIVGSTESSDYLPGIYRKLPTDLPQYTDSLYNYLYSTCQNKTISIHPSNDVTPIFTIETSSLFLNDNSKLNSKKVYLNKSDSITSLPTITKDTKDNHIYKKQITLEKKKSKLSLKSIAIPVKRIFSVDARRQFNCRDWLKCATFWKVAIIYMMSRLYFNLSQAYTTLYLTYTLKLNKSSIAVIPFVVYCTGFIVSLLIKPISASIGSRYVLLIGCIFSIISCVWISFGDENNIDFKNWEVYGATSFNGLGCTSILISSMAITADLIGDNSNSAFVFGIMGFFDKLINGLSVYFLELFNPELPSYYKNVLVYVAGGGVIFTLLGLFTIRQSSLGKINNDKILDDLVSKSSNLH